MSGSFGTANTPLDIATQFAFLEPRTSDPTLGSEPLLWFREDLDDTNANPTEYGTVRYYDGSETHDIPVFEQGSSDNDVEEVLRIETSNGIGYIPIAPRDDANHPELSMQHASAFFGFHEYEWAGIVDSAIANYDATVESSTGSISSIADQVGSFDLSGSCEVISSGIDGKQSYRFDGSELMQTTTTLTSADTYGVLVIREQQEALDNNNYIVDAASANNVAISDDGGGGYNVFLDGTEEISSAGSTQSVELIEVLQTASGDWKLVQDGSVVDSLSNVSSPILDGLTMSARADDFAHIQQDIGEITVLENFSNTELDRERTRLADKWGITLS